MDAWDHCELTRPESNSPLSHPVIPPSQSCFTEEIPVNLPFIKIDPKLVQRLWNAVAILQFPDSFGLRVPKLSKDEDKEIVAGVREYAKDLFLHLGVVCLLNRYFRKNKVRVLPSCFSPKGFSKIKFKGSTDFAFPLSPFSSCFLLGWVQLGWVFLQLGRYFLSLPENVNDKL